MRGTKMNTKGKVMKLALFSGLIFSLILTGCERSVSGLDEAELTSNPNVFIDGFSGGLEYAVFQGAVPSAFQVDSEVTFDDSDASMRFDVPDVNDSRGSYAGGAFFTTSPRDLSGYNVLTFYAKSSESVPMDVVGFGVDLGENKFISSVTDFRANTSWKKYIIPIPDPSKFTEEKGMFYYSFGPIDGKGYTVWIDEVKFENLGTVARPFFEIIGGENDSTTAFSSVQTSIGDATATYSLAQGTQTVNASPAFFDFSSSNEAVATVNSDGIVTVGDAGSAIITASIGGVQADGSLKVISEGPFDAAPTPTEAAADVISIFSDTYENAPVSFYNGFYAPFQTTTSNDFEVNGDNVLNYENFNFVGIEFNPGTNNPVPTIDGSEMTNFKVSIYLPNPVPGNSALRANLRDFGPNNVFGTPNQDGLGDDTVVSSTVSVGSNPALVSGQWITIDIDISAMANKANLGQIVFDSDPGPGLRGASIYVDNIYLHK